MPSTKPLSGFRDFLPEDIALRRNVRSQIEKVFDLHGFQNFETPALENLDTLSEAEGDSTNLTFKVLLRGDKLSKALTGGETAIAREGLRYDLTKPFVRLYANNRHLLPAIVKRSSIGPVWRADRPQKGRYREFTQCDVDIVGVAGVEAELDLLEVLFEVLQELKIVDVTLHVNHKQILEVLCKRIPTPFSSLCVILDKLDKIGWEGVSQALAQDLGLTTQDINYLQTILDIEDIDKLRVLAGEDLKASCADLETLLSAFPGTTRLDLSLVRGLAYYTGMIFELRAKDFPSSLAGGGRYDDLMGSLNPKAAAPACGLSLGFDRILDLMQDRSLLCEPPSPKGALILYPEGWRSRAKEVAAHLRVLEITAEIFEDTTFSVKRAVAYAHKKSLADLIFLGEPCTIKTLATYEEHTVQWENLAGWIKRLS